ncbi:DUF5977 domain-containing protein [Sphingobacterium sp. 2149]|uniref:DUF5977 domain-containing protein n=1 Tax=Sphingobacterium sp. 2149 TaxID=2817763 RepID=UPI002854DF7C|nr:DUF5977 domain-containing protein [Sphingobacterium sp. 2149]MDR6735566.1 hypothetical protein [Sphingobacterium sp. 2149]
MKFIQILNRYTRKIAAIWGVVFLFELVSPMVAMALTAGPTAPEATSFEPVDTTDMVNPLTGSFTYNLPLLEVPGPEGGYPLSLSYHAGIRPDVEASWVGLGWTLNPGAINRNVAGLPDDFDEVSLRRRDYWSGGNRKDYGLDVGFASAVNVGLVFANDTYQGFGVGASLGYGIKFGSLSIGVDVGLNPYGGGYAGINASSGVEIIKGLGLGGSAGLTTNFESISFNNGVSLYKNNGAEKASTNLLSVSMSSSSNKPSLSVMGIRGSVFNSNSGKISTSSSGFGFTIPLGIFSIGASFRNTRYWIDETAEIPSTGSLYTPILDVNTPNTYMNNRSFDNYRLIPDDINIADSPEDYEMLGGTLPEYDNYVVTGQGIGGQIRPSLYQRALHLSNNTPSKSQMKQNIANVSVKAGAGFRFVNDFSNSFDQGLDDVIYQSGTPQDPNTLPFGMGGNTDRRIGNELAASKYVKYFTNDEIRNGNAKTKGFIDVGSVNRGFTRITNGTTFPNSTIATKGGSQIGGFMVTNESGVTYHYALPVYSFNEYSYNYTPKDNGKYTETTRKEPYAYTWLLTAVTGPDYVDRNGNGLVDAYDWGYWVAMDYGKWSNDYVWRTPAEGTDRDLDQNYSMYTSGQKELYYINKIRTRTHTAIFEKEARFDGKGNSTSALQTKNLGMYANLFDGTSRQSMRLNKVYLFNSTDASVINETSETINMGNSWEYYDNVIDNFDIDKVGRSVVEAKAIRIIDFGFSYDLSAETPNSFNSRKPDEKLGKLTLDGILFRGKGGVNLLPPTRFSYEESDVSSFEATRNAVNEFSTANTTFLELGMMIESAEDNPVYYGMVTAVRNGGQGKIYTLMNGKAFDSNVTNITLRQTKNPNYCKDCRDIWGFYKGDIDKTLLGLNEDIARKVTLSSAKSTDAWNLRSISSPTGNRIDLDYESNEFKKAIFEKKFSVPIKDFRRISDNKFSVELIGGVQDLIDSYALNEVVDGTFLESYLFPSGAKSYALIESSLDAAQCYFGGRDGTSDRIILNFKKFYDTPLNPSPVKDLYYGNIRLNISQNLNYGGGSRIKSIKNVGVNNVIYQTDYLYRTGNISNGVTSYLPINMETGYFENLPLEGVKTNYKKVLNRDFNKILKFAREIPGPGIMYSRVRIQNKVLQSNGDSQKEGFTDNTYRVMDERMISRTVMQDMPGTTGYVHGVNLRISDFTTNIGDVLQITSYDAEGRLVKQMRNRYLFDEATESADLRAQYRNILSSRFNSQGLVTERFAEARYHNNKKYSNRTNIVMAAREQYPSILLSSTTQDFINKSSESTENLGFDFYNGQPNKVLTKDSYGNRFLTETGFAYLQYAEMGNRLANISNKNMLTQVYSRVSYKVDNSNAKVGVVGGTKAIWSKEADVLMPNGTIIKQNSAANGQVWRKEREEVLEIPDTYGGSGILPIAQFTLTNGYWKLVNGIRIYNVYSKALEDYDRNNNYSANRYGYNNGKIIAGANFAKYGELAFSGAEDELMGTSVLGEVSKGQGTVSTGAFHTGSKSLSLAGGATGFEYSVPITNLTENRTYVASVWVKNAINGKVSLYYDVDGVATVAPINSAQSTKKSGDWNLVNIEIPISGGTQLKVYVKNEGTVSSFVDDFRFHPKNTNALAYVYDNFSGELTYILDHFNLYTRFEYDGMGRLVRTYKEQFGRAPYKTNEYQQNYGFSSSVYYNDKITLYFRKSNCTVGEGAEVKYDVPEGKYSSEISKGDANSKAMAEANQNGQAYANSTNGCITCKKYRVKVHRMNFDKLYFNYYDCNNQYRSVTYETLPQDINTGAYLVAYVCVSTIRSGIQFSRGQNQENVNVSAEIELVGNCD